MELLSLLLPIVVDLFNRKIKDSDIRFWMSFLVCAVVGVCLNYVDTMWRFDTLRDGFDSVASSVMIAFGLAQLSYKGFYENSGLRASIKNSLPSTTQPE